MGTNYDPYDEGSSSYHYPAAAPDPAPVPVGSSANPLHLTPEEQAWFEPDVAAAAPAAAPAPAAAAQEMTANARVMGGVTGAAGAVAGGLQFADGLSRFLHGSEQDHFHGAEDMVGGAAGVAAGGLGAATAVGAGDAALLGTTVGAAGAVAAPVAAAIGLGVAGDHRAEEMGLWGKDKDGHEMGTLEAAWNKGTSYADGTISGDLEAVGVTTGLEVGGAAIDVGLGVDALGASSGWFGSAENADGSGTHNRGAFEAIGAVGHAAGDSVDDLFGLGHDSWVGKGAGALVDGALAPLGLAADAAGGIYSGAKALGSGLGWLGGEAVDGVAAVGGAIEDGVDDVGDALEDAGGWVADLF